MVPHNLNFGGGTAESVVNPAVLMLVLLAGVLICVLPRRKAIFPLLFMGILVPFDQIVVLGGSHFQMIRVLAIFGLVRIFWTKVSGKGKVLSGGMNGIDWAFIVLTVFTLIDGALLWQSVAEVIFQVGNLITAFGVYFLLRHLIQDEEDVKRAIRVLAMVVVVVAAAMSYEYATGTDLFYEVLGGAHAAAFAAALNRAGDFRARGCFEHPNIAGSFGGFMFPLFIAWWFKEKAARKWAALGAIAAVVIPVTTGSSTALFALLGAVGALCLWPMRRHMRWLRWGVVGTLVAGQLAMTSPVWHIISDVSLSGGSSSYHRYMLVDQCIRHFWNWALVGTKTYASWGWDAWDLSNQYVANADTAGLIPLLALIAILVYGFKYIGKMRKQVEGNKEEEWFIWAIGASLFANLVAFWGISYFDQTIVPWYAVLAIISAVTLAARKPAVAAEPAMVGVGPNYRTLAAPARIGTSPLVNAAAPREKAGPRQLEPGGNWRRRGV